MGKPTMQTKLDCDITINTIVDSDIETVETASVHAVSLKLNILIILILLL